MGVWGLVWFAFAMLTITRLQTPPSKKVTLCLLLPVLVL